MPTIDQERAGRAVAAGIGWLAVCCGAFFAVAWALLPGLVHALERQWVLRPLAAVGVAFAGAGLIAVARQAPRMAGVVTGGLTLLVGALGCLSWITTDSSSEFNRLWLKSIEAAPGYELRIGLASALGLPLIGLAVILLSLGRGASLRQTIAGGAFFLGLGGWFAATIQASPLTGILTDNLGDGTFVAAALLMALGTAAITADRSAGWAAITASVRPGGQMARRMLGLLTGLIIVIGLFLPLALPGTPRDVLPIELMAAFFIACVATLRQAHKVDRLDLARETAAEAANLRAERAQALAQLTRRTTEMITQPQGRFDELASGILDAFPEALQTAILQLTGSNRDHLVGVGTAHRVPEPDAFLRELLRNPYPAQTSTAHGVLLSGHSQLIDNITTDDWVAQLPPTFRPHAVPDAAGSVVHAPIRISGGLFGVLAVTSAAGVHFTDADRQFAEDIAEMLGLAMTIASAFQNLENRIEERTADLDEANQDLRQFTQIASHDLQAPLRTVTGFGEILLRSLAPNALDDRQLTYLHQMIDGSVHMQHTIRDLLAYSRLDEPSETHTAVDLHQICGQVLESLQADIRDVDARIDVAIPMGCMVTGNAAQLEQLIQNLVVNSLVHRHPQRRPVIRLTAVSAGDRISLMVRDNGQGIPSAQLGQVVQPFRKTRSSPGTGMGLAICHRIATKHHGTLTVESAGHGKGTTVTVDLPAVGAVADLRDSTMRRPEQRQ